MERTAILEKRISSDESQLVLAAQKGDKEAFNQLVLKYQDAVYNLAYRILEEADSAEDITQNVFLTAYRSLKGFRNGSFRSWLFRITTNSCYDELRRLKSHPILSIEAEDETGEKLFLTYEGPTPGNSPEIIYAQLELERTIQRALNLLSPDQRIVVVLVDLQDMDYHEVAQVLQIPIGTVKSRLARGRVRLRKILNYMEKGDNSLVLSTDRIEESLSSG